MSSPSSTSADPNVTAGPPCPPHPSTATTCTIPSDLADAVLKPSTTTTTTLLASTHPVIKGPTFETYHTAEPSSPYPALFSSYPTIGFQASHLGNAITVVNDMLKARDERPEGCRIFLGYTSNLVSSGLREVLRFLVKYKMVDAIVTTAGGVEEDLIKCLAPTYLGAFDLQGTKLRSDGLNRIGNLLVPNDNYCRFEDWVTPILDRVVIEQVEENVSWTPSKLIRRLGKEMNHDDSILTWAARNDIPIFCPALTDGSLGDMIYFHTYRTSENPLRLDIVQDLRSINTLARCAPHKTGMIILGGGVIKHHICNANLMRNGADFAVYVNTAHEFDGSDAGASPDEAVSWGKIRPGAKAVKVCADATLVFPIMVAESFFRYWKEKQPKPE